MGGLTPLVNLLTMGSGETEQLAAAALEALARDCAENQVALSRAGVRCGSSLPRFVLINPGVNR